MLTTLIALFAGAAVGFLAAAMLVKGKDYDASVAEHFYHDAETRLNAAHESIARWRRLAVRQQTEIRVLHFAQDLYPDARDKRSRLASLKFELEHCDSHFTGLFTPASKQRMVETLKRLLLPGTTLRLEHDGHSKALSPMMTAVSLEVGSSIDHSLTVINTAVGRKDSSRVPA